MTRHGMGLRPDRHDPRDYPLRLLHLPSPAVLPPSVDLRPHTLPIRDQKNQGCCTGFALAAAREILLLQATGKAVPLSPAFLYWQERTLEGAVADCDAGAELRDGLASLQKVGICPETDQPYDPSQCGQPSTSALTNAAQYLITTYHRCATLEEVKQALASSLPVVLGIAVYESFEGDAVAASGNVPMPQGGEAMLGGHAVCAVGYQDDAAQPGGGMLTVRNSWSESWGQKGYFSLPYAYVNEPKLTFDAWTACV